MDVAIVPPTVPPEELAEAGERLYNWYCLPCHGPEGRGDGPAALRQGLRPRDLTRGVFKLKTSAGGEPPFDADLYRTIAVGIPAQGMPAFPQLDSEDIWGIVEYLKSFAPGKETARTPLRTVPRSGNPDSGRRLFVTAGCVACHGDQGRGDGFAATSLNAWIPDLTRGPIAFAAGSRAEDIYRVLTLGLPGTAMPSFAVLSEQDRWDLACHVTRLYRPVPPGETLFLLKGCTSCHTIGNGRRVGPDLAGIAGRRGRKWVQEWLRNPAAMIATDSEARKLYEEFGFAMPAFDLEETEVEAILDFLQRP